MLTLLAVLCYLVSAVNCKFQIYDQWETVDFSYNRKERRQDIKSGRLRPKDVVIYDSQLYLGPSGEETLLVTTPNLFGAAPFTLSTVSEKQSHDGGSLLEPYPDVSWYSNSSDCSKRIISVFRTKVDRLQRLWVVDTGMVNQLLPSAKIVCPPKILIFDLKKNNSLIGQYNVPSSQHYDDSLLVNIELDLKTKDGSDTVAYISDVTGYRMLVYSLKSNSSYTIDNPYFNPFPVYCFFTNINGVNFTLLNGLNSVSLGAGGSPDRTVYFNSLSSARQGFVKLSVLSDSEKSQDAFSYSVSRVRGYHSSVEVMTPNDFLIFTNIEKNSLLVWDTKKEYTPENFVTIARDDLKFQFITGLQLLGKRQLLVTSSRYQNVITGNIARHEINYRVLINLNISKYITRN